MPMPRSQQVCLDDTPYYHCVARCVRRAFLCGEDPLTGTSYEHRRGWVERRLFFLASVFSTGVCAYAVMSNHIHVVLYVDAEKARNWSLVEVLTRWHKLHKGTPFTHQYLQGGKLPDHVIELAEAAAETYRARLTDISWFMKELNEPIARRANLEDECTGHFWEGRFKSQALLDETALMACMAYVDLNPIRSGISTTSEESEFTSIKKRIAAAKSSNQPTILFPFVGNPRQEMPNGLPFKLTDYLELVDITGRTIKEGKKGAIDGSLMPILQRLNLSSDNWLFMATEFEARTGRVVGQTASLDQYCDAHQRKRYSKHNQRLG